MRNLALALVAMMIFVGCADKDGDTFVTVSAQEPAGVELPRITFEQNGAEVLDSAEEVIVASPRIVAFEENITLHRVVVSFNRQIIPSHVSVNAQGNGFSIPLSSAPTDQVEISNFPIPGLFRRIGDEWQMQIIANTTSLDGVDLVARVNTVEFIVNNQMVSLGNLPSDQLFDIREYPKLVHNLQIAGTVEAADVDSLFAQGSVINSGRHATELTEINFIESQLNGASSFVLNVNGTPYNMSLSGNGNGFISANLRNENILIQPGQTLSYFVTGDTRLATGDVIIRGNGFGSKAIHFDREIELDFGGPRNPDTGEFFEYKFSSNPVLTFVNTSASSGVGPINGTTLFSADVIVPIGPNFIARSLVYITTSSDSSLQGTVLPVISGTPRQTEQTLISSEIIHPLGLSSILLTPGTHPIRMEYTIPNGGVNDSVQVFFRGILDENRVLHVAALTGTSHLIG